MKKVIFPIEKEDGTNLVIYPDDRELFTNTNVKDNNIVADYSGELELPLCQEPCVNVYYHIELSGGDSMEPIGIVNDGAMSVDVVITARTGADPASPIFELINGKPWRVAMRNSDGMVYDIVKINFDNSGMAAFSYKTTGAAAIVSIDEKDLSVLQDGVELQGHIVGDNSFKVYREIT